MNNAQELTEAIFEEVGAKMVEIAFPIGGSIIVNTLKSFQSKQLARKVDRIAVFAQKLYDEVLDLKEAVNTDYFSNPDYLDIFEQTINMIAIERTEAKRESYRKILVNSLCDSNCDYDKTEKYLRLLDRMDVLELKVLIILSKPEQANKELGNVIKDPNESVPGHINMSSFWNLYNAEEILSQLLNVNKTDIDEAMYGLELERLIVEESRYHNIRTNDHPIRVLDNLLTAKGKDFLNYIKDRETE